MNGPAVRRGNWRVSIREWNDHAVGREIRKAADWISGEAWLGLLAVGNHGRTGFFEAPDGVPQSPIRRGLELLRRNPASVLVLKSGNEFGRRGMLPIGSVGIDMSFWSNRLSSVFARASRTQ